MKNNLKIWLRKLDLTPDPNDYAAVVSYMGNVNKQKVIDALIAEGTDLKRETIEDVVNRYNRLCAFYALQGWTVDTGLVYMRAIVTGPFYNKKIDPARNSIYVSVTQGVDVRREVADTKIEILGEAPDTMYILQVVNTQSKMPDGTLTRGRTATIEGAYLKIAGDNPACGVYLTNVDTDVETKLPEDHLASNLPSKLMILVPAEIPTGNYRLKVVTQFTSASRLLNSPREAVFEVLTVI